MKRNYFFGTIIAIALGVTVAAAQTQGSPAQTGAQSGQSQPIHTQGTPPAGTQTTGAQGTATHPAGTAQPPTGVTGTQGTATGSQGAASGAAAPGTPQAVTLTGCLTPAAGSASAANAAGGYSLMNATGGTANGPTSYTLMGGQPGDLLRYSNSRVEVIGSMDPQPAAAFNGGSQIGQSPIGAGATGAVGTSGSGATPVTGATHPPTATATASGSPTSGTLATGTAGSAGSVGTAGSAASSGTAPSPTFHVTSVRQVPGSCGGQ